MVWGTLCGISGNSSAEGGGGGVDTSEVLDITILGRCVPVCVIYVRQAHLATKC